MAEIHEMHSYNQPSHLVCETDGFPNSDNKYIWHVIEIGGGLVYVEEENLYIVDYTVSGPLVVECEAIATSLNTTVILNATYEMMVTGKPFDPDSLHRQGILIPFIIVTTLWSIGLTMIVLMTFYLTKFRHRTRFTVHTTLDQETEALMGQRHVSIKESELLSAYITVYNLALCYSNLYHTMQRIGLQRLADGDALSHPDNSVYTFPTRISRAADRNENPSSNQVIDDNLSTADVSGTASRRLSTTVRPARQSVSQQLSGKRDSILITDLSYFRDRRRSLDSGAHQELANDSLPISPGLKRKTESDQRSAIESVKSRSEKQTNPMV